MNKTKISWTDYTSNPIRARDKRTRKIGWWCSHASTGCLNCYSETLNKRYGNQVPYHAQEAEHIEFVFSEQELAKWKKLPAGSKVFAFDMLDLFHEKMSFELIWNVWMFIANECSHLTIQILTKRAARMSEFLQHWNATRHKKFYPEVLPNVWLGVSVENQKAAHERIPLLLQTPAAIRFLSCEPLLGDLNLFQWFSPCGYYCDHSDEYLNSPQHSHLEGWEVWFGGHHPDRSRIDWCICGGESGPHYREMNLDWARSIRDQCVAANVPFFFKQQSAYRSETNPTLDGVEWHQFPSNA